MVKLSFDYEIENTSSNQDVNHSLLIQKSLQLQAPRDLVPEETLTIFSFFECVTSILCIFLNGVVLMAVRRSSHYHTRVTFMFIGNLALTDLLVGVSLPPTVILPNYKLPNEFYSCLLVNCIISALMNASLFNILGVTLDRFCSIRFPFYYIREVNYKRAVKAAVLQWVLGVVFGFIPLMGWNIGKDQFKECNFHLVFCSNYLVFVNFFSVALPIMILTNGMYLNLILYLRRIYNKSRDPEAASQGHVGMDSDAAAKMNSKCIKSLAVVSLIFALCWLPLYIFHTVIFFSDLDLTTNLAIVDLSFVLLSHVHSFFNPIIYAFGTKRLRDEMLYSLRLKRHSKTISHKYSNRFSGLHVKRKAESSGSSEAYSATNVDTLAVPVQAAKTHVSLHTSIKGSPLDSEENIDEQVRRKLFFPSLEKLVYAPQKTKRF